MPSVAYNNLRKHIKSPRLRRVYVIRDNMKNELFKRTFTFLLKNDDEYSADYYKQQYIVSLKKWI